MDRFPEPDEEQVLFNCNYCGGSIYKGEDWFEVGLDRCHLQCFEYFAFDLLNVIKHDGWED